MTFPDPQPTDPEVKALKDRLEQLEGDYARLTRAFNELNSAMNPLLAYKTLDRIRVHGIEIGKDFFRGEQGVIQMNVGLEQRAALVFVDEFIDAGELGSYSPLNSVEGRADGVITHLQFVSRDSATGQALFTVRGKATTVIEGQSFDGTNTGKFQLYPTYFQVEGIPILLGPRTTDPSLSNGMVWHRSDLGKIRARINGTTENLATESYVDAAGGGMKTSGGGYYLIPAGPASGTGVTSSASANTYGSWTEMRAASGNALYIVGVIIDPDSTEDKDYIQLDIGTGGAGAETSIGEFKIEGHYEANVSRWMDYFALPFPIPVASSTRIACRLADGIATARTSEVTLHVIDQADLVSI